MLPSLGFWRVWGALTIGAGLYAAVAAILHALFDDNGLTSLLWLVVLTPLFGLPLLVVARRSLPGARAYFLAMLPLAALVAGLVTAVAYFVTYRESDVSGAEQWAVLIIGGAVGSLLSILPLPLFSFVPRFRSRAGLMALALVVLTLIVAIPVAIQHWALGNSVAENFLLADAPISILLPLLWQVALGCFLALVMTRTEENRT
jgi:hypothetical protein